MINLFPAHYLRPARAAGENADGKGGDTDDEDDDDTDDDDADDSDDDNTDDGGDDADTDAPNAYIEKSWGLRKKFLREFSVGEVAEMWQVHNFMTFAFWYAQNYTPNPLMLDRGSPAFTLCPTDTQFPPAVALRNGPSATAGILRALRSFDEPKNNLTEHLNWDLNYTDSNWPGFLVYLQEKNYDTSKVGINTWDPVQDNNVILDNKVEATEECKCPTLTFDRRH